MQTHRDTAEVGLREVWAYLVLLRTQKFYGNVTLKFREGVVVGHVHEDRDYLVNGLPQATPEQIAEVMQRSYDAYDDLAKVGQKQGDMMTAAIRKRQAHGSWTP